MPPKRKALTEIDPNRRITAFFPVRDKTPDAREDVGTAPVETLPPAQSTPPPVPSPVALIAPVTQTPLPLEEQLLVMQATPAALNTFCNMLQRTDTDTGPESSRNQSLPPVIRSLTNEELLFPQDTPHGHCHALFTRTRRGSDVTVSLKLTEGGTNNDSPRSVPPG